MKSIMHYPAYPAHPVFFFFFILFVSMSAWAAEQPQNQTETNRILYLIQAGHLTAGIEEYKAVQKKLGHHDPELLQQIGLNILDHGYRSDDHESQLLTVYGAGIAMNEKALYILEKGIRSSQPELQMASLNFLSMYQNDRADEAMLRAMSSDYLLIRLEGAFHLSQKKAKISVPQTEALMCKIPYELTPLFPQLYAMNGSSEAIKILRRLLVHPDEDVRVASILSAAKCGRDDLLPIIRKLSAQHGAAQQEAAAWALGIFKDEASLHKLQELACSKQPYVRLAALQALYRMGSHEVKQQLIKDAKGLNPFAILALAEIPGSEDLLFELSKEKHPHVKINAAVALLELKDPRCLQSLEAFLVQDNRDLACLKLNSQGGALPAYRVVPSVEQNAKDNPMMLELSLSIREELIAKASALPEAAFLALAHRLFEAKQNDVVPCVVNILEAMRTPGALALLKKHQQQVGAPLIRNYCNLALYRLKEEGPYADNLKKWISQQQEVLFFRTLMPWELRDNKNSYQLTPQETARLLVESFEALMQRQEEEGLDILLTAIQNGNVKNRYALAGLLMRASL